MTVDNSSGHKPSYNARSKYCTVRCAYSGVVFKVEHLQFKLVAGECTHPVFALAASAKKKLWQWCEVSRFEQLVEEEQWLLWLALLDSTRLLDWRCAAQHTSDSASIIAEWLPRLVAVAARLASISNARDAFPHYVIQHDTAKLDNIGYWIEQLEVEYEGLQLSYVRSEEAKLAQEQATRMQKLTINVQYSNATSLGRAQVVKYAKQIASWAALVGSFPEARGKSQYWQEVIIACCKGTELWALDKQKLEELVEYCEYNIPHGSVYAFHLMDVLRRAVKEVDNCFGLELGSAGSAGGAGSSSPGSSAACNHNLASTFKILEDSAPEDLSKEEAARLQMIEAAPRHKPIESEYKSKLEYVRAKLRYEAREKYLAEVAAQTNQ